MCFQIHTQRQPDWLSRELCLKLRENESLSPLEEEGRQQEDFKGLVSF